MSDDLKTRLRAVTGFIRGETGDRVLAAQSLPEEAADRIADLERQLAEVQARPVTVGEQYAPLVKAAEAMVDFHNGPTEAKRPDIFLLRMKSIGTALRTLQEKEGND